MQIRLPAGRYYALTDAAVVPGRLTASWTLREPASCLAVRPDVPLEDRTAYEMLMILEADGWIWVDTKNFKRDRGEALPIGYKPGEEKIFISRGVALSSIYPLYLKALYRAEDSYSCNPATQFPFHCAAGCPPCLLHTVGS